MSVSMSPRTTPGPRATPVPRSKSKGKGDPNLLRRMQEARRQVVQEMQKRSRETPTPQRPQAPEKAKPQCSNKECPFSDVIEDEGKQICMTCGCILQEVQITQELTFGETANGAAVVQGTYVGANEETARSSGLAGSRLAGGLTSRQVTERIGSTHMNQLVTPLRLTQTDKERGMRYYNLAASNHFIQGRVAKWVAGVCLYMGCRVDPQCRTMLIDIAEKQQVNVFKLGRIYNEFVKVLCVKDNPNTRLSLYECNPENLIQRFAADLEFGPDEHRIANEAVQILKRMKRDWILTGRRAAGVCGAALILAARMNNYCRTVREVVYTAKVADITIHKRLDEFKETESSKLTIDEFRHHGVDLEKEHDPPAFYQQNTNKNNKRRKRKRKVSEAEDVDNDEVISIGSSRSNSSATPSVEPEACAKAQADRRAMPPPTLTPIDPRLTRSESLRTVASEVSTAPTSVDTPPPAKKLKLLGDAQDESDAIAGFTQMPLSEKALGKRKAPLQDDEGQMQEQPSQKKRKAGRPKGSKNKPLPEKSLAVWDDERLIEDDLVAILGDPEVQAEARRYHDSTLEPATNPLPHSQTQQAVTAGPVSQDEAGGADSQIASIEKDESRVEVSNNIEIDENEFADDPEVRDCLLSRAEIEIKERLWVTDNAEYLLKKQKKMVKAELEARSGTARVVQRRQRRRPRLGDMSTYQNITREDGSVGPPTNAAEAVGAMMQKQAGKSKKVNWEMIKYTYTPSATESPSERSFLLSGSRTGRKTRSGSRPSREASTEQPTRVAAEAEMRVTEANVARLDEATGSTTRSRRTTSKKGATKTTSERDLYEKERRELDDLTREAEPDVSDGDDDSDGILHIAGDDYVEDEVDYESEPQLSDHDEI